MSTLLCEDPIQTRFGVTGSQIQWTRVTFIHRRNGRMKRAIVVSDVGELQQKVS